MIFNIDSITEGSNGSTLSVVDIDGHVFLFTLRMSTVGQPDAIERRGAHLVLDAKTYTDEMQRSLDESTRRRVEAGNGTGRSMFEIPGSVRTLSSGELLVLHAMNSSCKFVYLIASIRLYEKVASP